MLPEQRVARLTPGPLPTGDSRFAILGQRTTALATTIMTVIAGFDYTIFSILVADSRLTDYHGGNLIRCDVCQKMLPLGDKGLLCWAGGLDAARDVMARLQNRGRAEGPWWLLDEGEVRSTLLRDFRPGSFSFPQVSFIAQIINPTRRAFEGDDETPRVDMVTIDMEPFRYEAVPMGTRVRGSGDYIVPRIEEDELHMAVYGFSSARPDFEMAVINKALFAEEIVERLIREKYEPTVGGLYQVGYLLPDRARVLSYERWTSANNDDSHGTYVTLKVENGSWWQEHGPTGNRSMLLNPFTNLVESDFNQDLLFDASLFEPDTPGVVPTPNPLRASSFLSAHGVAEHSVVTAPPPSSDQPLGPEGIFQRIGPNPWNVQQDPESE